MEIALSPHVTEEGTLVSAAIRDVTERKRAELDLASANVKLQERDRNELDAAHRASYTDALTGLGNRAAFDRRLASEIARHTRYRHPVALVFLDADGLKSINETYGHDAGDELRRALASALDTTRRRTDFIGRIGGDEFAAILPETDWPEAERFADRLRQELARRWLSFGKPQQLEPSCWVGIAVCPDDAEDAGGLFKAAEAELDRSKAGHPRRSARPQKTDDEVGK